MAKKRKRGAAMEPPPPDRSHENLPSDAERLDPDDPSYDPYFADDLDEICRRAVARPNT